MTGAADDIRRLRPAAVLVEMGNAGIDAAMAPAIASHGATLANAGAVLAALGFGGPVTIMSMDPGRAAQRSADSPRLLREINDHVVLELLLEWGR